MGQWTPEETAKLCDTVKSGHMDWNESAANLPGRSAGACRRKWHVLQQAGAPEFAVPYLPNEPLGNRPAMTITVNGTELCGSAADIAAVIKELG